MSNDNSKKNDNYNLPAINDALDTLGMLSTVTQSRKEYIQENENFFSKLQLLNMNGGDKAGPSFANEFEVPLQKNFFCSVDKMCSESGNYNPKLDFVDPKEKENKALDGFQILTMNSQFITSFKTGYSFPLHELTDSPDRRVFKYSHNQKSKRRCRSHPYERKSLVKVVEQCLNSNIDSLNELDQTACRLRTASLSSGTSGFSRIKRQKEESFDNSVGGLKRSRSMENLIGSKENSFTGCDKTKDIETVSKGIQEMQMEDCT
ncbi:hypothetical protein Anas_06788, partial [Armadillidium nasatum]